MPDFRSQLVPVKETFRPPFERTPEENAAYEKAKVKETGFVAHPKAPPRITQKMPEGVSKEDRALIANFSNDPNSAVNWLQKKYPDFDIKIIGDQIGMKPKGSTEDHFALIPNASITDIFKQPSNLLQKISDHAYDIAAGIATAEAAALGAPLGAGGGPLGMLGTGAAAAGTAGAALEAGRQQVGKELGINTEIKPGEVATSGLVNAASVPLFGAGRVKGLAGKTYDVAAGRVAPWVAEVASGVPAEATRNYVKNASNIKAMSGVGTKQLSKEVRQEVRDTLNNAKLKVGQEIGDAVGKARAEVDLTEVKKPWKDLLAKLENEYRALGTPELAKKLADVRKEYEFYFSTAVPDEYGNLVKSELTTVSPQQAFKLKESMSQLGELDKVKPGAIQSSLEGMTPAQKELASTARDSKSVLTDRIASSADATAESPGLLTGLNKKYSDIVQTQKDLNAPFKTTKSTARAMSSGDADLLATLRDMDLNYGSDLMSKAQIYDAYKYYGNPSFLPVSTKGTVSTGRIGVAGGTGAAIGSSISNKMGLGFMPGAVVGGGAGTLLGGPAAIKQYAKVGQGVRNIQGVLGPLNSAPGQIGANIYGPEELPSPWTLFGKPQQGNTP